MIPIGDQLKCAQRELEIRRKVYPGWVKRKRMTFQEAARETERMEAVVVTLAEVDKITQFIQDHLSDEEMDREDIDRICLMLVKLAGFDLEDGRIVYLT